MPNRPSLPAPGTPMTSHGPMSPYAVLQPIFDMVGQSRQVDASGPISAMVGAGGLQFTAPNPPIIKLFELTTDFTTDDLPTGDGYPIWPADSYYWAKGKIVNFFPYGSDRSTQQWHVYSEDNIEEYIFDPAGQSANSASSPSSSSDDGSDPPQPAPSYKSGDRIWCISDAQSGFWVVLAGETNVLVPIELKEDMTPADTSGGSGDESTANGWIRTWDSDTAAWTTDYGDSSSSSSGPDNTVTFHDPENKFCSLGYDSTPEGEPGAIGWAQKRPDGDYDIVNLQEQATLIYGTATDDVDPTDDTFELSDVGIFSGGTQLPAMDGGSSSGGGGGTTLTCRNAVGAKFDNGVQVTCMLKVSDGNYYYLNSPCSTR